MREKRVSLSFVQSLLKRYRTTDTVEPKPHGGGNESQVKQQTSGFGGDVSGRR